MKDLALVLMQILFMILTLICAWRKDIYFEVVFASFWIIYALKELGKRR